jgi:hypothetical protein
MIKHLLILSLASVESLSLLAQTVSTTDASAIPPGGPPTSDPTAYAVTRRGADHNVWSRTVAETTAGPNGRQLSHTESYTEIATGLNFEPPGKPGQWTPSSEKITLLDDGSAVALQGRHQASFPADIYQGAITITTPEGLQLQCRPFGLCYSQGTNSILISELKSSIGQLSADQTQITWPDAFTDFKGDLVAKYKRSGVECDLVIRQWPSASLAPEAFAMDSSANLQLITEFFNTQDPEQQPTAPTAAAAASQSPATNQAAARPITLRFGSMIMPPGKAFPIGNPSSGKTFSVRKSWNVISNRKFLVEELPLANIAPDLQSLQAALTPPKTSTKMAKASPKNSGPWFENPPARRPIKQTTGVIEMAQADATDSRGFCLDWEIHGSASNVTLQRDTCYFLTGPYFVTGWLVAEGNAIVKVTNSASAKISFSGPFACQSRSYSPVVFTSYSDDSVGPVISSSTHSPVRLSATFLEDNSDCDNTYRHLRFSYAATAVSIPAGYDANTFWHCQFVNCATAIDSPSAVSLNLCNVLISKCGFAVWDCNSLNVVHLTCDQCGTLVNNVWDSGGLTNCILTAVTNISSSLNLDHCVQAASGNGIYQAAGGGSYYLAPGVTNQGTTNIDAVLQADLHQLTTWPPIIYSNTTISSDTTFYPQARRDAGVPSPGYHFYPLDYCFGGVTANANLTFASGVAVGWFRVSSGWTHAGHGIHIGDGYSAAFNGTFEQPDFWVRCSTVQDGANGNWSGGYGPGGITGWTWPDFGQAPQVKATFTRFSILGNDTTHMRDDSGYLIVNAQNCEFWGGSVGGYASKLSYTNCHFDRVSIWTSTDDSITNSCSFIMRNALMHGGILALQRCCGSGYSPYVPLWSIRDSAFDSCSTNFSDAAGGGALVTDFDYNAFAGARLPYPGANDITLTNFNWLAGHSSQFYLPTNSPLIDAGDGYASNAALFHYTTSNQEIKETNSVLDLSYHSVAVAPLSAQTLWVDESIPAGATAHVDNDQWLWTNNPSPFSGSACHRSLSYSAEHQHYFDGASSTLPVGPNDTLFCEVYLTPTNLPSELMVQWEANDGTYWHRAIWGSDNILGWGQRAYVGPIPTAGGWVRFEVPARDVDLAGRSLIGMSFALYGGTASWDYAGTVPPRLAIDTNGNGIPDYLEDKNGNGTYDAAAGETDWLHYNSANGLTGATGLLVFTPLR